jgi:RimJ/RimL family protein N-acetyltransferase
MIPGSRVNLRPIGPDDLPILRRWFDDPQTMRHWAQPQPLVPSGRFEADLAGRFARFDEAGYFMIDTGDGTPIGRIEFERLSMANRNAEVMILIGEPSARGKGYGADAMVALLGYLFRQRNIHRVSLTVLAWNERAIRSYARVGFLAEGRLRDDVYADGRYQDQIVMAILRDEFEARWSANQDDPRPR